ncbi:MAG: DUF1566 domain-containing protein [Eubacteriales bacterium]
MNYTKIISTVLATSLLLVGCQSSTENTQAEPLTLEGTTDSSATTSNQTQTTINNLLGAVVTTGQTLSYDQDGFVISPSIGEAFYGQDSDYASNAFSFTLNDDGTTYDHNTGLTWETIPLGGKMTWEEAVAYCENLTLGGYDDWRIPTVEELFSISDFSNGWPFLDTDYFQFDDSGVSLPNSMDSSPQGGGMSGGPQGSTSDSPQGGTMNGGPQGNTANAPQGELEAPPQMAMAEGMPNQGTMNGGPQGGNGDTMPPQGEMTDTMPPQGNLEELPAMSGENQPPMQEGSSDSASKDDGQFWTASHNMVEGDSRLGDIAFGVNHSTGHIKAYPASSTPMMGKYVRAVRGDVYGAENYTDNGDGTITDNESGLMWLQVDLGVAVDWEEALSLAESSEFAGYDDWRLPNVKELQSIVDYSGSYPAINQSYFTCTELPENENYYYWTSTSAYFSPMLPDYDSAWYVAFGYTSHGAGAVRFSPKYVGSSALSEGEDNILNSVRLVRNVE